MTDKIREALAELLEAHASNTLFGGAGHWERARAALAEPEAVPAVLHECLDNDSPWLVCKHCGAVGRCEMEQTRVAQQWPIPDAAEKVEAAELSDERTEDIDQSMCGHRECVLPFARAVIAADRALRGRKGMIELPKLPPSEAFSLTRSKYTEDDMRDYGQFCAAAALEAAAKVCHDYAGRHAKDDDNTQAQAWMMLQCAAAIRALRGEKA